MLFTAYSNALPTKVMLQRQSYATCLLCGCFGDEQRFDARIIILPSGSYQYAYYFYFQNMHITATDAVIKPPLIAFLADW